MIAAQKKDAQQTFLVATFYLGSTFMGIETLRVQEIIRIVDVTRVHHAQDHILGIVNLRGKIVTIVDLSKKLDLPESDLTDDSRIVIVDWKDEYIGLLVDRILDVRSVDRRDFEPPPTNIQDLQGKYLQGVFRGADHLIAIVDVDKVLEEAEK